jgi:protocatechuate 3,4-dioxygenase beta subunit
MMLGLLAILLPFAAVALSVYGFWPDSKPEAKPRASAEPAAHPVEDRRPEIRGRVLDAEGNPVMNAAVRLVSTGAPYRVAREAISDREGAFSFARLTPQHLLVVADHEPEGFVTSAEVSVRDEESQEITLVLSATRGVRGTVVDGDHNPVAGAMLSVEGVPWRVPVVASDASGAFHMILVPDQATSLRAVARGYRPVHVALEPRDGKSELVVKVTLSEAPPVQGFVRGDDGEPVSAQIVACSGQASEEKTTSEDDGSFELSSSTIGCDAVAHLAGYASSDPVGVAEGRRLELRLKTGGSIEGEVKDDKGSIVRSYSLGIESFVTAGGGAPDKGPRAIEDALGAFRWEKLAAGRYVLTASVEGLPPARSAPVAVSGGVVTRGVTIVIGRGGTVVGTVVDDHNTAIAGADVSLDPVSSLVAGNARTITDASGRYRLDGAPPGPFSVRAEKAGFRTRMVSSLHVSSGATLSRDIALHALATASGDGTVEFYGIGAMIEASDDGIVLGFVGPDDPAGRAGLEEGDEVLSVDGESTETMSDTDVTERLRGEPGTSVTVSVQRGEDVIEVTMSRGLIIR